jgi:phage shock protein C
MNTKRLTRSQSDRMLGGVCAGLAKYFAIDPTIVRLLFLVLTLGIGSSFLIYIVLWIIIPREDLVYTQNNLDGDEIGRRARQMGDEMRDVVSTPNPRAAQFLGIALVVLGLSALIQNLNIPWLRWFNEALAWPLVLIVAGGILLFRAFRK